ncbi:alpha/beta fold hydrolase [Pseudonocardia hispaniensis]|uniref:Alpha/beta fold hydrolase n=1 Tax=Pseudonocardia hispaniensis TaxID=904933 RepID=A0ABW1J545_9PSEU
MLPESARRLNVHMFGSPDGIPVLALHGATGHGARWRPLAEAVPELRWIGVDLRGHGRSPWSPPWGIEQHVRDAIEVLDRLEIADVAVVGHSFGGAIAVHLARAAPDRVERLVLLDPAIGLDPDDMLETAEDMRADETYPDIDAARADRADRWKGVAPELIDAEVAAHLAHFEDRWEWRYCRSAAITAWSEMARPALTPPRGTPTLIMPASRDDFVEPAWLDRCRAELGDALTVTEIDSGHMIFLERTAEVATAIREFVVG